MFWRYTIADVVHGVMPTGDPDSSDAPPSRAVAAARLGQLERRERRRELLLDAAVGLFGDQGYSATSIEQICQSGRVGTKSFYELFENKEACYLAVLEHVACRLEAGMVQSRHFVPATEDDAVAEVIASVLHALTADPRVVRLLFARSGFVSTAVETRHRAARQRATEVVVSIWQQYRVTEVADRRPSPRPRPEPRMVATGLIGGASELLADWLVDADPTAEGDVRSLAADLSALYYVVRDGLARPSPGRS